MKKYIHIGFPKNFSTSLQRDYFSKHPDLFHLGIGIENNLGYRDSIIEKTLEVYLKTCKSFKYNEVKRSILLHFNEVFNNVSKPYKAVGISSEHLSFSFSYDSLSSVEKANRLFEIFGNDTKIIMIIRNQFDLIKSLYRESVRIGFAGDFNSFFELLYKYQDRNFVYDLRYDFVYKTYTKLFGKHNVKVLLFEDYRNNKGVMNSGESGIKLFEDLNNFLGLDSHNMKFDHYNEAIPSDKILIKAKLNNNIRHDLGNHLLESAEKHRIKTYLEQDLGFFEKEEKTFSDVLAKRILIKNTLIENSTEPLTYVANESFCEELRNLYLAGNEKLENDLGTKLHQSYKRLEL